ncbi:hypothetical protein DMUE_5046 [Dictyocoela muelleri]|nr:hypothetical protein DMUE_5046 [Dictyocoela muelleri]
MDTDRPISTAEAYILLSENKSQRPIFNITYDYVKKIAKIKDKCKIEDLIMFLRDMNLNDSIISKIITLFPQSVHEYKTIIGNNLSEYDIDKILHKLGEYL